MKKFFSNIWTLVISIIIGVVNLIVWTIMAVADIASGGFLGIAGIVALIIMAIVATFIGLHFWAKKQ